MPETIELLEQIKTNLDYLMLVVGLSAISLLWVLGRVAYYTHEVQLESRNELRSIAKALKNKA